MQRVVKHKYTVYYITMERTKVTEKYQVTIPKSIREKIGLKAGEIIIVEAKGRDEIRLKRFRKVKEPLKILVGKRMFDKHIPIDEIEERMEE